METPLDLSRWPRRAHFDFFRRYEQPYWNLTAPVDVTALFERCRAPGGPSFFLASFYLSLAAANDVEALRCRLRGEGVVVHDVVHGGSTVLLADEIFAFAYFDFVTPFARFLPGAEVELARVKSGTTGLKPRPERDDLLHYSVLPWVSFTSFAHARRTNPEDSVPKVVFGKHYDSAGRRLMPVSLEVHHALVDGVHVGRFFEGFQALLDQPALE